LGKRVTTSFFTARGKTGMAGLEALGAGRVHLSESRHQRRRREKECILYLS
jgi:hypothetical protein